MTDHADSRPELEPRLDRPRGRVVLLTRITIGFAQGLVLYLLSRALPPNTVNDPISQLLNGLTVAAGFVPPFIELGVGTLGARSLTFWAAAAAVVTTALGAYARARQTTNFFLPLSEEFLLFCILASGLFVATVLLTESLVERRLLPSYSRYFETAWRYGIQLAMALLFVLLFEGILQFGASLFGMIGIHAFATFISQAWFWMPATATAGALAINATDAAPGVLRGVRSLALTFFSWLLPLFALIVAGFLGRVSFASLAPLWDLEYPTGVLLAAAGLLVFLINSHYQDGSEGRSGHPIRRAACALAMVEIVPLVLLAAWALGARVSHYGWTVNRIFVAAAIVIAASYAVGYGLALIHSWKHPSGIEMTNIVTAYLFLAVLLLLSSPLADPARLMVANQVARLNSGAVSPEQFDFDNLSSEGERWGSEAIARLAAEYAGPKASFVRRKAAAELAGRPFQATVNVLAPLSRDEVTQRIQLFPAGAKLPEDFVTQIGRAESPSLQCLTSIGVLCFARSLSSPSDSDSTRFLVIFDPAHRPAAIDLFRRNKGGRWKLEGSVSDWQLSGRQCQGFIQRSLEKNTLQLLPHGLPDIVFGQQRLAVSSPQNNPGSECL